MSGRAFSAVHTKVPLAHHMCSISCLLQMLRQKLLLQGYAVGLAWPYNLMLHTSVDLGKKKIILYTLALSSIVHLLLHSPDQS